MRKLMQRFHNMKMSLKLLASYALIVSVAISGMGIVLFRSAHEQLRSNAEQMLSQAAQAAGNALKDRCTRVERSIDYLAADIYVQRIVNETNYLSEYQKAYDVNNYLEPTILSVMEQNPLIATMDFYTYGEVKNTRIFIRDMEDNLDNPLLRCGEQPVWRWDGENVTAARVLANIWQPNQSAVLVYTVDQEELFSDLLPEMELDCMLQLRDGDNNLILEQTAIADAQRWEKNAEGHVRHVYTLPGSGWELTVEGDTTLQTQAMPSDVMLSMGLILAGLCLLMLLVAWNFSHKISSRLNELRQQVNRAVTEEYQNDIFSCDRDEIGEITNAVGTIVHETRQLLQQTYQSELDRRDAQIQALQAQINPHFLYNTLSNLNWRLIAKGDEEGSKLVTDLSRFYRLSLNGGKILSTIAEEIQQVETYISLYRATHEENRLTVQWSVDEGLSQCKIPGMILQPIVENAFEHGHPESDEREFLLKISVQEENEKVVIRIADNGPGLQWEGRSGISAEVFFEQYGGYGLRNVYRRLQLLFEEPCSMSFEPTQGGGTTVVLHIPLECGQ